MPYKLNRKVMLLFVKIFFERQNHIHFVHITFDGFDAVFFPSPNLRRYIIMCRDAFLFCPSSNSHIKSGIINKNNHIWIELFDVLLAEFYVRKYGSKVHQNLYKSHESQITIMLDQNSTSFFH